MTSWQPTRPRPRCSTHRELNADDAIHGILVQLPLPPQIERLASSRPSIRTRTSTASIRVNVGRLAAGKLARARALHAGRLPDAHQASVGKRSPGWTRWSSAAPTSSASRWRSYCCAENCTVTVAHSRTRDLPAVCRSADIVVAAVGRPEMVRGDWMKPGAIVIDVGMNRIPAPEKGEGKTRLVGDVAFAEARRSRRRDHPGAGRRRADDHRHADGEHADGGIHGWRFAKAGILGHLLAVHPPGVVMAKGHLVSVSVPEFVPPPDAPGGRQSESTSSSTCATARRRAVVVRQAVEARTICSAAGPAPCSSPWSTTSSTITAGGHRHREGRPGGESRSFGPEEQNPVERIYKLKTKVLDLRQAVLPLEEALDALHTRKLS